MNTRIYSLHVFFSSIHLRNSETRFHLLCSTFAIPQDYHHISVYNQDLIKTLSRNSRSLEGSRAILQQWQSRTWEASSAQAETIIMREWKCKPSAILPPLLFTSPNFVSSQVHRRFHAMLCAKCLFKLNTGSITKRSPREDCC